MRACAACGASNRDTASWCSQCYARFDAPQAPPSTGSTTAATVSPATDPPAAPGRAGVRRRPDGGLEWVCSTCATVNPIEASVCAVCATSFAARFAEPDAPPEVGWGTALALSAVLPGAGHVAVGRTASGLARGLLAVVWGAGAALLLLGGGGRALPAAGPLLVGTLVLWAGSLVDLQRLAAGRAEVLAGRAFAGLVAAVTLLALLGLLSTVPGARG